MIKPEQLFNLGFLEQMDDKNFIIQVIILYLQDTDKDLAEMKGAFEAGNLEVVYKTAHKLKSSTGMLQANKLYAVLEQTESIAKQAEATPQLTELVTTARMEFCDLKSALELHLKELQNAA